MRESRTEKSVKNSVVAMLYYAVNLLLQFVSRKVFIDCLGTEVLGLNTTAVNLFQFLNLAELGISSAVGFTLYKPIAEGDKESICEIVTLQKYLYSKVAWVVIAGACILMVFFPLIFAKITLPLWYAYASFGTVLFSALLGYFVNYKQIVLTASQQDYKVLCSYQTVLLIRLVFQIFAVKNFANGYVWWLILQVVFAGLASVSLHVMTKKTFPYLRDVDKTYRELRSKYTVFVTKIKQLFFHKIGGFALFQSSSLILYAYASLSVVAVYGNYLMITEGVRRLFQSMFNGIGAGVGNMVATDDTKKCYEVFNELFSLRFLMIGVVCFAVYNLAPPFISLWVGEEYLLPTSTLILIVITLYIGLVRITTDEFIGAYGLFQDIWAPIVESVINIGLSILLGYFYGLNGILVGVLISQVLIVRMWKTWFLFHNGLKGYLLKYLRSYGVHLALFAFAAFVSTVIIRHIGLDMDGSWLGLIGGAVVVVGFFALLLAGGMLLCGTGLVDSVKRFRRRPRP